MGKIKMTDKIINTGPITQFTALDSTLMGGNMSRCKGWTMKGSYKTLTRADSASQLVVNTLLVAPLPIKGNLASFWGIAYKEQGDDKIETYLGAHWDNNIQSISGTVDMSIEAVSKDI